MTSFKLSNNKNIKSAQGNSRSYSFLAMILSILNTSGGIEVVRFKFPNPKYALAINARIC
jgi:hypothetical protein